MRPSSRRVRSMTVKYCWDWASCQSATMRMAAVTAAGLMAGEISLASGPGSSGSEPNWRELSRAIPARRRASVLGGATGVSVRPGVAGGCCASDVRENDANIETLAARASTPNFCRPDIDLPRLDEEIRIHGIVRASGKRMISEAESLKHQGKANRIEHREGEDVETVSVGRRLRVFAV